MEPAVNPLGVAVKLTWEDGRFDQETLHDVGEDLVGHAIEGWAR